MDRSLYLKSWGFLYPDDALKYESLMGSLPLLNEQQQDFSPEQVAKLKAAELLVDQLSCCLQADEADFDFDEADFDYEPDEDESEEEESEVDTEDEQVEEARLELSELLSDVSPFGK